MIFEIFLILSVAVLLYVVIRNNFRLRKRIRYVMEATLNGDFSYKFPTSNVNKDKREINIMLNRIVEHLENLTLEVRQKEAFLSKVLNLTDIGFALADSKGDIRLHNKAALRILNRPVLTHRCQIPDYNITGLDIRKSDVTVNDKSFILFTITDLGRQLQTVEVESWDKLTRVLTHEIMNSLTPIQSIAENMSGKAMDQDSSDAFATISSSSQSLMQFVKNFREFSIVPKPQMKAIYIRPLLESSIRMAKSYVKDRNISFSLICFPPELLIYTDETLLSRVLLNVIKNAIEANPQNITIEVEEKADESLEIRISNDGELIPEETAEHIFTPFFTTRPSGNGIGLSISRRIITSLGGTLSLKTNPQTTFSIRL